MEFKLSSEDKAFVGEPLKVRLRVNNTSEKGRTVSGTINITTMYYTGVTFKQVFKAKLQSSTLMGNVGKIYKTIYVLKNHKNKSRTCSNSLNKDISFLGTFKYIQIHVPLCIFAVQTLVRSCS